MKTVILAGGAGTRLSEETDIKPKPMIEIGERPILWHLMKVFSHYNHDDFVICCGYKGYQIKEYFANYYLHESDISFDFSSGGKMDVHSNSAESWKVTLVNTGNETQTGGRIKRIKDFTGSEAFMLTYGDGLADINIHELMKFHKSHGKLATVTAVRPSGRFGALELDAKSRVESFSEKNDNHDAWINGGFFILEPKVFDYIDGDNTVFEKEPLERLAKDGQLHAFKHDGFWQPMDTLREKKVLENHWQSGKAPWKVWK